ncbi:hypothetical protein EU508_08975 [Pseudoalteromonas fuliginea]|uniref:Uncharacterized protein n=1 Tax=Pseudoalteromonas fuliginea TaxID=1872678 RepID=A0AB73BHL3_9GAMM|nr:hypothetical protein EU508_08975 [Pseudoalteromonas fuliginea]
MGVTISHSKGHKTVGFCSSVAYLYSEDHFTGKSYEHRRGWVEVKQLELAKVFCIDICALPL